MKKYAKKLTMWPTKKTTQCVKLPKGQEKLARALNMTVEDLFEASLKIKSL